jgi:hypothetical protein
MNVLEIPLERYQKARAWINDSPINPSKDPDALFEKMDASSLEGVEPKRIAIEVAIPIGFTMYGLLGGQIQPCEGGFELVVKSMGDSVTSYAEALVSADSDDIRCGLADEFLPIVVRSLKESVSERIDSLPNARLTIDVAAHGAVGSNQIVFKKLAELLLDSLIGSGIPTQESLSQSINE